MQSSNRLGSLAKTTYFSGWRNFIETLMIIQADNINITNPKTLLFWILIYNTIQHIMATYLIPITTNQDISGKIIDWMIHSELSRYLDFSKHLQHLNMDFFFFWPTLFITRIIVKFCSIIVLISPDWVIRPNIKHSPG